MQQEVEIVKPSKDKVDLRSLPLKQRKFVQYYKKTGNGTKSAKLAGYAESGAHVTASRLLRSDKVLAILHDSVEEAELVVKELLHSDNEDVRLKAAKEVLDRSVGKSVARTESVAVNITVESMLNDGSE